MSESTTPMRMQSRLPSERTLGPSSFGKRTTVPGSTSQNSRHSASTLGAARYSFDHQRSDASQVQISIKQLLIHPKLIPQALLKMVCGDNWLNARAQIQLFPLRFMDAEDEKKFLRRAQVLDDVPYKIAIAFLILVTFLLFTCGLIMDLKHYWGIEDALVTNSWHLVGGITITINLILLLFPFIKKWKPYVEVAYYNIASLTTVILCAWTVWSMTRLHSEQPAFHDVYEEAAWINYWLKYKMVFDSFVNGITLMNVIQTDMLLNTLSRYSIFFHIFSWVNFMAARVGQCHMLDAGLKLASVLDCILFFLLYFTSWFFRWFRELQDRAVIVSVKESQARVARVREAQRNRRRRKTVSAAEELSDMLLRCRQALAAAVEAGTASGATKSNLESIQDSISCIDEVLKRLASSDTNRVSEKDRATVSTEPDEVEEDMFLTMYQAKRHIAGDRARKRDSTRKESGKTGTGVRFGNSDTLEFSGDSAPMNMRKRRTVQIFGVDMPELIMTDQLRRVVGIDFGLRLLDYYKGGQPILQEVGWVLLRPYIDYLEAEEENLRALLFAIEFSCFKDNPYHNPCHSACVAHYGVCILNMLGLKEFALQLELQPRL
eukprot:Blabericola_migrator_1__3804@NODE_2144_length_3210_cov_31_127267_g5_i1_p1_GENE_NODE_2144_length_3210_cov_31_127267_g5_i1NODE_2144_length_3210_cov_31_127267_g5_i1_p1_ORF_typecomplete_len604_score66_85Allexi_40kDa/PF05549_11/0_0053RPC_C/PF11800_8/0_12TarH/PF02203_15/6_3e03TarH/PF02203_15/0_75HemY_N/PF07219_13/1_2e04HemY_N/PF07219_13/0_03_NODE_2144_length_3210_cov_31_127267_g5_i113503161